MSPATAVALPLDGDTVRIPGAEDPVIVRPGLAMLYRLAVGPHADRYAGRFLSFEQRRWLPPGWNWSAFAFGPVWAGYRGLWWAVAGFAVLPLLASLLLGVLGSLLDIARPGWSAGVFLLVWMLPGVVAALAADVLVYRRVRRRVLIAESQCPTPDLAAAEIISRPAVTLRGALIGIGAAWIAWGSVAYTVDRAYRDHVVREQVRETLEAVRDLQLQIERTWANGRVVPEQTAHVRSESPSARAIGEVHVSPATGRLRILFGSEVPELDGSALLLVPTEDARRQIRWLCIPVGMASVHLPRRCRRD